MKTIRPLSKDTTTLLSVNDIRFIKSQPQTLHDERLTILAIYPVNYSYREKLSQAIFLYVNLVSVVIIGEILKIHGNTIRRWFKQNHISLRKGLYSRGQEVYKTSRIRRIRNSVEYKKWRVAVFQRDDYTCQFCDKRGGDIEAHHKIRFVDEPKLRFVVDNGITLCLMCHGNLHRKSA